MRGSATEPLAEGLVALVLPETRAEVLALRTEDTPAGQLFFITLREVLSTLQQSDRLIDEATGKSYLVSSWSHFETPRSAHTEVTAEAKIGNS